MKTRHMMVLGFGVILGSLAGACSSDHSGTTGTESSSGSSTSSGSSGSSSSSSSGSSANCWYPNWENDCSGDSDCDPGLTCEATCSSCAKRCHGIACSSDSDCTSTYGSLAKQGRTYCGSRCNAGQCSF
ncbi:MAG TPA: hypothetical protein VIF62_31055 [Labilithrix sp.]